MKTESEYYEFTELNAKSMAGGIGRKAADEELIHYLEKGKNVEPIGIEEAFSKYQTRKQQYSQKPKY
jgi:hypothetical protein